MQIGNFEKIALFGQAREQGKKMICDSSCCKAFCLVNRKQGTLHIKFGQILKLEIVL